MIEITKHGDRSFAVHEDGELLTVCVYRKGAVAVKERMEHLQASIQALEVKCATVREPLVWEEFLDRPELNDSAAGNDRPSQEGLGRESESEGDDGIPGAEHVAESPKPREGR